MSTYTLAKTVTLPKSLGDRLKDIDLQSLDRLPGGFTSDTKLCWVASGSYLEVLRAKTAETISCWHFGSALKVVNSKIVSIDELKSSLNQVIMLAVGLEYLGAAGMVCIFDIYSMKVVRAIQIPEKVTFVHVIYNGNEHTTFPGVLNSFDGALAVGTVDGNVYIVDLCREVINEARQTSPMPVIKDEVDPCTLMILRSEDLHCIESHKEEADRKGYHLAIHLNALVGEESPHFILKGPKGDTRLFVNKAEVFVSSLHFAPQLSSLLVGYNFGALQLWDLISMNLVYTSPVYEENIPISHFAVQEPVDDPRPFCYFWAVYSDTNSCCDSFPVAALYSLCYDSKEWHDGYGYIYQNLQSCHIRFQTDLSVVENSGVKNPVGAQCVRLYSLSNPKTRDLGNSSITEFYEESYKLCLMAWNVWSKDRSSNIFLSVFDLNQWYKEQMPNVPNGEHSKKYMTTVCISDIFSKHGDLKFPAIDIHIDPTTISLFKGAQNLEEHYYPTSLAFDCHLLTEYAISQLKNYGVQRKFFHTLGEVGPLALLQPPMLYEKSIAIGLTPLFMEPLQVHLTNATQQREHILSIALENKMRNWLYKCASSWGNGSHRAAGLSLDLLLNWAWNRAKVLKSNSDLICTTLFDYSGVKLDQNGTQLLNKCRLQILVIKDLYKFVRTTGAQYLINPDLTKKQHECLERIYAYLDVLGWMYNIGLLPEHYPSDMDQENELIPYRLDILAKWYEDRRVNNRLADGPKELFGKKPIMFIDQFIKMCGSRELDEEWTRACGTSSYPPTSLQALLRTYLVEDIELEMKHVIVSYLFMDIADSLDPEDYKLSIANLLKFPVIFQFTRSQLKLIQGFWHLDHNQLGSAGEFFIDPMLESRDMQPWHHKHILSTFMLHDSNKLALLYLTFQKPPINGVKDVSTVIIVYIKNKMIQEAFNLHREHSRKGDTTLLKVIFKELLLTRQLKSLLTMSLTREEEEELFMYLDKVVYRDRNDYKAVYYSVKGRYFDFKLNVKQPDNKKDVDNNFSMTKICTGIFDTMITPETKKMVDLCLTEKKNLLKNSNTPKPLSAFLFDKSENVKYKSDFSFACVAKSHEIWYDAEDRTSYFQGSESKLCSDDFPFLWTLNSNPHKQKYNSELIYPKIVTTFKKTFVESAEEDGPSPTKRMRLSPRPAVHTPQSSKENPDVKKLLTNFDTPVISVSGMHSGIFATDEATPQSILKEHSVQREISARLSYLATPKNVTTSDDKPIDSAEKRVILIPSKRRSVVRFTDNTSANNAILSGKDLLEDVQMDISPLPGIVDTNVSQKSYLDMDESTSESFYSPEVSSVSNKQSEEEITEKRMSTLIEKDNTVEEHEDYQISSKQESVTNTSFTKKIMSTSTKQQSFIKQSSFCMEERSLEKKSLTLVEETNFTYQKSLSPAKSLAIFDFEENEELEKDIEDEQICDVNPNTQEVTSLRRSMSLRNRSFGSPVPATLKSRKSYKGDVVKKVTRTSLISQLEDSPLKGDEEQEKDEIPSEEQQDQELIFKRSKSPLLGKRKSTLISTQNDRIQSHLSRRSYREDNVNPQDVLQTKSTNLNLYQSQLTKNSNVEEEEPEIEKPESDIEDEEMIEVISLSSRTTACTMDEDAAFYEHIKQSGLADDSNSSVGDANNYINIEFPRRKTQIVGKIQFGDDNVEGFNSSKLANTIIDDDFDDKSEPSSCSKNSYDNDVKIRTEPTTSKTRYVQSEFSDNSSDVVEIPLDIQTSEEGSNKSDTKNSEGASDKSYSANSEECSSKEGSNKSDSKSQSKSQKSSNKSEEFHGFESKEPQSEQINKLHEDEIVAGTSSTHKTGEIGGLNSPKTSDKKTLDIDRNSPYSDRKSQGHEEHKLTLTRKLSSVKSFGSVDSGWSKNSNETLDDFEKNIDETVSLNSEDISVVSSPSKSPSRSKKRNSLRTSIFKPVCRRSLRSNSPKSDDSLLVGADKRKTIGLNMGFICCDDTFSDGENNRRLEGSVPEAQNSQIASLDTTENIFEKNISSKDISTISENEPQVECIEVTDKQENILSFKEGESNELNKGRLDFNDSQTEVDDTRTKASTSVEVKDTGMENEVTAAVTEKQDQSGSENKDDVDQDKININLESIKASEEKPSAFEDTQSKTTATETPRKLKKKDEAVWLDSPGKTTATETPRKLKKKDEAVLLDSPGKTTATETPRKLKKKDEAVLLDSPARRTRSVASSSPPPSTRTLRSRRSVSIELPQAELPKTPRRRSSVATEKPELLSPATRTRRVSTSTEPGISIMPPTRRTTRAKSVDAAIEENTKPEQKSRGRKSILPAITEDIPVLEQYSENRRMTRKQKEMFLKNMKIEGSDKLNIDLQSMDPIQLLDKEEFKGKADPDEEQLLEHSPAPSVISSSATETGNRKERGNSSDRSVSEANYTPRRKNARSSKPKEDQPGPSGVPARRVTRRSSKDSNTSLTSDAKNSPLKHALSDISEEEHKPKTKRGRPQKH